MPIPQDQAVLKSYFNTGDKPTEAQFAELIDTMFALYQDAKDTANGAVALIAAAAARYPRVYGYIKKVPPTLVNGYGIATVTTITLGVRITFTTPFADTNYTILLTEVDGYSGANPSVYISAKNVAWVDVKMSGVPETHIAILHT